MKYMVSLSRSEIFLVKYLVASSQVSLTFSLLCATLVEFLVPCVTIVEFFVFFLLGKFVCPKILFVSTFILYSWILPFLIFLPSNCIVVLSYLFRPFQSCSLQNLSDTINTALLLTVFPMLQADAIHLSHHSNLSCVLHLLLL